METGLALRLAPVSACSPSSHSPPCLTSQSAPGCPLPASQSTSTPDRTEQLQRLLEQHDYYFLGFELRGGSSEGMREDGGREKRALKSFDLGRIMVSSPPGMFWGTLPPGWAERSLLCFAVHPALCPSTVTTWSLLQACLSHDSVGSLRALMSDSFCVPR